MKRLNIQLSALSWARRIRDICVLAVAVASSAIAQSVVPVRFGNAAYFATDGNPVAIATADFNYDGQLDIAAANTTSNTVSILLGLGDGTFSANSDFAVAFRPTALAVGDLNNDTNLDIIMLSFTNLTVLLGNGTGDFSVTNLTNNLSGNALCLGDFNKDGKLDVASSVGRVAFGNGDGSFGTTSNYYNGITSSVSAGDVNGDGSLDLAFSGYYSFTAGFSILTNKDNGTFSSALYYGPSSITSALVLADLDGDGRLDVAALVGSLLLVRTNSGGSIFGATNWTPTGISSLACLAEGDFNCGGKQDLVARSSTGILKPLLGNGDASFINSDTISFSFPYNNNPKSVATGDFNRDGKPDIMFVSTNSVGVLLNETPPSLEITRVSDHIQVSWSAILGVGYALESTSSLSATNGWQPFPPVLIGNRDFVADFVMGNKFYRLRK